MAAVTIHQQGPNFIKVALGYLDIYFSYETPVAFWVGGVRIVRDNVWGSTTGKHLNSIDGGGAQAKRERVSGAEFDAQLNAQLARLGLDLTF